jgi:hypothetical protein
MEKDIFVDQERMYRLFEGRSGELSLAVLCGDIAVYEVSFVLSSKELEKYMSDGKAYLDSLSFEVAKNPELFESR